MKIKVPGEWKFSTEIQIRITDLNYGNHLANQNFLAFAQEGRMRFFQEFGFSELNFGSTSLIQADAAIIFKGEGFYKDRIRIHLQAERTGNSSFNLFYELSNADSQKTLALIRTAMVCYNYELKKVVAIPEEVLQSGLFS